MIIVRRSTSNVNKLQNILSLSTSSSPMTSPLLPSTPSSSGGSGSCSSGSSTTSSSVSGGGQNQSYDWSYVLSPENKSKAIQLLTLDKENCNCNFRKKKTGSESTGNDDEEVSIRKAAVLIPLCIDVNGKPSLLYNLRSLSMTKHRGEISFPGGSLDPEDKGDPIAAALRETHEELGIDPGSIEIWTRLRMFPTLSADLVVIPVLGFVKGVLDPTTLRICPEEVDHAFTVTLEHLCDPQNWEEGPRRKFEGNAYNMPMWRNLKVYTGGSGGGGGSDSDAVEIPLWGLTAFVTHIALLSLLPKNVYERKLPYLQLQRKKLKGSPKL